MSKLRFPNWTLAHQEYNKLVKNYLSEFHVGCFKINIKNDSENTSYYVEITEQDARSSCRTYLIKSQLITKEKWFESLTPAQRAEELWDLNE